MTTVKIQVPEDLRAFVKWRAKDGNYDGVSEYVAELIRADQARVALRDALAAGLSSPVVARADERFWKLKARNFPTSREE